MKILFLLFLLSSCSYSKPLPHADLIVPPFIQDENPEIYEVFKAEEKK